MLQKKILNFEKLPLILLFVFTFVFFVTRVPRLATDEINPDGVNWHDRSQQFVVGLKTLDFARTYQHYHPGVTLMWITGLPIELVKQIYPENQFYNHLNFLTFHFVAKFSLVLAQLVLSLLTMWLLTRAFMPEHKLFSLQNSVETKVGNLIWLKAFFIVTVLSLEPFFLGNSRIYHMDVLLSLILFNALLFLYWFIKKQHLLLLFFSAWFFSAAFLTKSVAIGGFFFALLMLFASSLTLTKKSKKKAGQAVATKFVKFSLCFVAFYVLLTLIMFPALLTGPVEVMVRIFDEAERVGIRKGHSQIFFGKETLDPGPFFYPLVFLMKVSPFTLLGLVLYLVLELRTLSENVSKRKNKLKDHLNTLKESLDTIVHPSFTLGEKLTLNNFLFVFYLVYLVVFTISSKKLDRYLLPIFPFFALLAVEGYYKCGRLLEIMARHKTSLKSLLTDVLFVDKKVKSVLHAYLAGVLILFTMFIVFPLFSYFPYYFVYTSPVFINPEIAGSVIAQKPFGIAIPELKEIILARYGDYPNVGFIDTKPMKTVYMGSRIYDIREYGPGSYDLIILGIGEELTDEVLNSEEKFELDYVYKIKGLTYWRIYKKEGFISQ